MSSIARVQSRGQVTVPQEIRETCSVEPGSELLFVKVGERRFECQVLPQPGSLIAYIRQHQIDGPPIDVEQFIADGEEQMAEEFIERFARGEE